MSGMLSVTKSSDYTYCFLPVVLTQPVEEIEGDGSGGLGDDQLLKNCKRYFSSTLNLPKSDGEKAQLVQQIRTDARANGATEAQLATLSDEAILNIHTSTSCEITALTIPCPANGNIAVSMYSDDKARAKELALNVRATALARGCGHGEAEIYGDAFVSRYHDDEIADIWERVDIKTKECEQSALWTKMGGGGSGKGGGSSLSSLMSKQQQATMGAQAGNNGGTGKEITESGYSWTQTSEEVEIKIPLPSGTNSKQIKIKFGSRKIKVDVAGKSVVEGDLGGAVILDDCTYTIENGVLLVVLGKQEGGEGEWTKCVL